MASHLLNLSNELHLHIFVSLNDLDDARDLGRTCLHLSQLHIGHKRRIARAIIVSQKTSGAYRPTSLLGDSIQHDRAFGCRKSS